MVNNGTTPIGFNEYAPTYYGKSFLPNGMGVSQNALQATYNPQPLPWASGSTVQQQMPTQDASFGITDIASFGKDIFGQSAGVSGVTGAINSVGANLGFGGVSPTFVGPLQSGVGVGANAGALTSASLSSVLGAAGVGYVGGGMLADMVGLNAQGGSIGGGAGAAIGTAIAPGIGTIVGGVLGSLGGGLFGGSEPNPASVAGSNYGITPQGTFKDGGKLASKHVDTSIAQGLRDIVDKFNTSIHQQTGLDLSNTIDTLYTGYDVNNGPGFLTFNSYFKTDHEHHNPDTSFYFDPNNPESMSTALRNYGTKLLEKTGQDYDPTQVNKIVNTALSSISTPDSGSQQRLQPDAIPQTDTLIQRRLPDKARNDFDSFLSDYRTKYNNNSVQQ